VQSVAVSGSRRRGEFQDSEEKKEMKLRFHISHLAFALALAACIMMPALADETNKEMRIETSVPLQIPGHVLDPGTYIFKLAGSPSNRNIVEVFSVDSTGNQTFVTTILAISAYRLVTPDKPIINTEERPAGTPEAIRSWFYPGDNYGWEFVYPQSDRLETAQAAPPAPVPVEPQQPAAEPVAAPAPEPPPAEEAAVTEPAPAEPDTVVLFSDNTLEIGTSADRELPNTAGYSASELLAGMTLLGLGGLILFPALRRITA
jgi:hypothetical protein